MSSIVFFFFYIENVFGKLEHKKLLWNYLTMNNLPMQWGIRATIYKEVSLLLLLQYVLSKLALLLSWWPDLLFQTGYTNKVTLFFTKIIVHQGKTHKEIFTQLTRKCLATRKLQNISIYQPQTFRRNARTCRISSQAAFYILCFETFEWHLVSLWGVKSFMVI